jgi:hypothetical protein
MFAFYSRETACAHFDVDNRFLFSSGEPAHKRAVPTLGITRRLYAHDKKTRGEPGRPHAEVLRISVPQRRLRELQLFKILNKKRKEMTYSQAYSSVDMSCFLPNDITLAFSWMQSRRVERYGAKLSFWSHANVAIDSHFEEDE